MNALPLKNGQTPHDVIDSLIADFGIRPVLVAVAARLFRRRPVLRSGEFNRLEDQPGIEALSDHLRADLGLPPSERSKPFVDPIVLLRRDFF